MRKKQTICLICASQKKPPEVIGDPIKHLLTMHKATEFFAEVPTFDWEDISNTIQPAPQPIFMKPMKKKITPVEAPVEEVVGGEEEEY